MKNSNFGSKDKTNLAYNKYFQSFITTNRNSKINNRNERSHVNEKTCEK
jgi:hypothetical protein